MGLAASFKYHGFSESDLRQVEMSANFLKDLLFPNGDFPPLKSSEILIERIPSHQTPLYVSGTHERIIVNSEENRPWQFTYQLAHELGHLSSRSDLRHPRRDGNMWIEEAICGAYSCYALRSMASSGGRLAWGASKYLENLDCYNPSGVNRVWFNQNSEALRSAIELTPTVKRVSGYIVDRVRLEDVVANNRALIDAGQDDDLGIFLNIWEARCGEQPVLPILLRELAGL